jgi:hypothetical protein
MDAQSGVDCEPSALSVLDRLAALQQIISPQLVQQVLRETGRTGQRACTLSHEVMLWIVLAMGVLTDLPIRQVFKAARFLRIGECSPGRSALCQGRQRLGLAPVQRLFEELTRPLATAETRGSFYRGLRRVGVDGSQYDVPDSEQNAAFFGYPHGGRGDGAFPQIRKVALVELGTHVEFALACGPLSQGELTLAAGLYGQLPPKTLLYQDRNFFSFEQWKALRARGIQILARVKRHLVLPVLISLPDGSYLSKIYPSSYDREKDRHGIWVRVICYTIDDPGRPGHGEEHRLLTSLLSARHFPAVELIVEYHERWEHEITLDEEKTHQDPKRPTKPAHLRSETPDGVIQELHALSIGHFVVRAMMHEAALQRQIDPDRLSFTGAFQIIKTRLPECGSRALPTPAAWWEAVVWEIGEEQIPSRANRSNPRVIKQKVKKWPKKRPHHRHPPPLTKPFAKSIVMLR